MVRGRAERQEAERQIVRSKSIRTQQDLVLELSELGFVCTQATVSRDIAELNLRKMPDGIYVLPEDLYLQRMVAEFAGDVDAVNNQVVLKTRPGTATGVASAIDAAGLASVLGTIAGNDTVLLICRSDESARTTKELLQKLNRMGIMQSRM